MKKDEVELLARIFKKELYALEKHTGWIKRVSHIPNPQM